MRPVPFDVRVAAYRLGLGDLNAPPACKTYANGCSCETCAARAAQVAKHHDAHRNAYTPDGLLRPQPTKPQPWHHAA